MKSFTCRFIILLLLLLQGFTPLVHAHVQSVESGSGLHLHEFDSYIEKQTYTSVSSLAFIDKSGAVIDMSAAIKQQTSLIDNLDSSCFYFCVAVFLQQAFLEKSLDFSPYQAVFTSAIRYSVSAPRAPPL